MTPAVPTRRGAPPAPVPAGPALHPRQHQVLHLPGGRRLGYAEYGAPSGVPILAFHGSPGSRLARHPDESIARRLGARVIATDRPGYGLSTAQPGRRLLDYAADVAALADALGLDRFAVLGVSGGGPHALACAHELPGRVTALALVGSPGPMDRAGATAQMLLLNRLLLALARRVPGMVVALPTVPAYAWFRRHPAAAIRLFMTMMPAADRRVLRLPAVQAVSRELMLAAFSRGRAGLAADLEVLARPWGFSPAAIRVPTALWHGDVDSNVPAHTGTYLGQLIPGCRVTACPGEGHELLYTHWPAILAYLLQPRQRVEVWRDDETAWEPARFVAES